MKTPLGLVVLLLVAGFAAPGRAAESAAKVTYLSGSTVYVDAGTDDGLELGDRIEVIRGGAVVAVLKVEYVSNHKASCSIVEGTAPTVGDAVRYEPAPEAPPAAVPPSTSPSPASRKPSAIHGRAGIRYLWVNDRAAGAPDYAQPALDLRLDAADLRGSGWGFDADVRARRTIRSGGSTLPDDGRSRVYKASFFWNGKTQPWGVKVGRQFLPEVSGVSLLDGVAAQYRGDRWGAGIFTGSEPDPEDTSYSGDVRDHGVWFGFHGAPSSPKRWRIATGLVGSYQDGEVNREFLFLQGNYVDRIVTFFLTQEIDYNRGWKKDAGESTFSSTGTFASLLVRAGSVVRIRAGYDDRRNVRLYRDYIDPATTFDDSHRKGAWIGLGFDAPRYFRAGLEAKRSTGGDRGDADVYGATWSLGAFGRAAFSIDGRHTRYTNDLLEGWLHAVGMGVDLGARVRLGLTAGIRDEDDVAGFGATYRVNWYALDLDAPIGRHWFLSLSADRSDGDYEAIDQIYLTTSYRF